MDLSIVTGAPDGRTLDVYVGGPEGALPLLFHNGTPSSGQLYDPFVQAASQRGLRMVSFSRAGYGDSTRNPGRSIAHVIADVAVVLDQLGADRFYTLGWSGGGPHALACAALLPERLIGVATVGCLAPYDAKGLDWMAGMGQENLESFRAALPVTPRSGRSSRVPLPGPQTLLPTRSLRASATLSRTLIARPSLARSRPGWQRCSGSRCGTESGAGMTMRSPL